MVDSKHFSRCSFPSRNSVLSWLALWLQSLDLKPRRWEFNSKLRWEQRMEVHIYRYRYILNHNLWSRCIRQNVKPPLYSQKWDAKKRSNHKLLQIVLSSAVVCCFVLRWILVLWHHSFPFFFPLKFLKATLVPWVVTFLAQVTALLCPRSVSPCPKVQIFWLNAYCFLGSFYFYSPLVQGLFLPDLPFNVNSFVLPHPLSFPAMNSWAEAHIWLQTISIPFSSLLQPPCCHWLLASVATCL